MTRILRLLLIAAIALPAWHATAALENVAAVNKGTVLAAEKFTEKNVETADVNAAQKQSAFVSEKGESSHAVGTPISKSLVTKTEPPTKVKEEQPGNVVKAEVKTGKPGKSSSPKLKAIRPKADIPSGYALVVYTAEDVWGDGTGYQMLLDKDATIYATWYNNGSPSLTSTIYNQAEYKIPENADYNANGNASNFLIGQTGQVLVPAGTYDILIVNPTPGYGNYLASNNGNIGGRIDDYAIEAGMVYEFTTSYGGNNDRTDVVYYNPLDPTTPGFLKADPAETTADITWVSGENNDSWNLRWRPYVDPALCNRLYDLPLDGYMDQVGDWYIIDADGDGINWGLIMTSSDNIAFTSFSYSQSTGDISPDNWLISPNFTLGGTLRFKAWNFHNRYLDQLEIYVSTNPNWTSPSDFVKVGNTITPPYASDASGATTYTINLNAYEGVGCIAFRHNSSACWELYVDDIELIVPNGVTQPDWIYENNVTSPHVISGLTAGTTYEVQVQGVGNNTTTYWTNSTLFTPFVFKPRDVVVKNEAFFDAITYNWTDADGGSHTSKLTDIATDPNQMIAMLREVYTNRTIPGNLKRGFSKYGGNEQYNDVDYAAVGTVMGGNPAGTGYVNDPNTFMYDDSYGWAIPTDRDLIFGSYNNSYFGQCYYSHLDPTEYKPNEDGVTLLLVEAVDDYSYNQMMTEYQQVYNSFTSPYDELKFFVEKSIKSVRIATEAVRTGTGLEAGTLFKIDCDKMNKFFLIAKGQLRWAFNSFLVEDAQNNWNQGMFCPYPGYIFCQNTGVNQYVDELSTFFLYHMFEQFSPVDPNASAGKDDIYQELVNMESFGVEHDCVSVPALNHQFLMYGEDSEAADCQDVRDLMFFVPDYRMMKDADRDNGFEDGRLDWQQYLNYNKTHQPTMGLYVIRQDEVTPTTQEEDYYQLQLNWRTNLDMFLPSKQQEFHLLRVVVDEETGVESYEPVYYRNENGEYTDADGNVVSEDNKVPIILIMEAGEVKNYPYVYEERYEQSRQVTYAIQGRDADHFLSLQISNRMSYIIPGTDPSELLLLSDMTHYSRFDAERVRNCYSNELSMTNNDVDGLKQANLTSNTQLIISRTAQGSTEPTTVATVTFNPSNNSYTVQMANQATDATEFPECADGSRAGYHANNGNVTGNGSWTNNYQVNSNGTIDLGSLIIFDNFVQEIPADNSHPNGYTYQVTTNYECTANQPTSVFLNPGVTSTGDEVWYAWTWNNDDDGNWVLGAPQTGGVLQFASAKNNIIFARMNPQNSNVPSWDAIWNRTGDLSTVGYMGKTFTLNGWDMTGYWAGDVIYDMAHSNAFRIPIYKTSSQINGVFSQADVDGDTEGSVGVPENVEFGVGVQLSSKTEILRYDAYRWEEGEPRYSVASADGDDEQDLPPNGLAMNQGEYYTISMNPDTDNETNDEVSVANGSGTATFVDEIPGSSDVAGAYIYAPIVETFTNRGDYNTYGGPLQSSAVGKLEVQQLTGLKPMSSYYWTETVDGQEKKFAYYDIELNVPVKELPSADYQIYKVRVWRQILDESGNPAPGLLREEYATQSEDIAARMGVNGKFMFEINYDDDEQMYEFTNNAPLGSHEEVVTVTGVDGNEQTITYTIGTFGAQKLRTEGDDEQGVIDELNLNFKVRMYFTRTANLAQNGKGVAEGKDDKFYIVEQEIPVQIQGGGTITGIVDVLNAKQIVSEKYYNPAGIESDKPFQGVNIVVTRYSDGSTSTVKVLK